MTTNTKNSKAKEVKKKDIEKVADILSTVEKLPTVERIAMQYYIKGTLEGIRMTENSTLIGIY